MNYIVHFLLECVGDVVLILAYRHRKCVTRWHKFAIWFAGTLAASVVTVQIIG